MKYRFYGKYKVLLESPTDQLAEQELIELMATIEKQFPRVKFITADKAEKIIEGDD